MVKYYQRKYKYSYLCTIKQANIIHFKNSKIMTQVTFKFDNKDVVVVKDAENVEQAWQAAEDFLQEETDGNYSVVNHGEENEEGTEQQKQGKYEFKVKAY